MTKPRFLLALAVGLTGLIAGPAYAHGFGERTELPIPLGYFIIGAAITVAVSFFIVSFFVRATPGASYRRSNLFRVGWLQRISNSPLLLVPLKGVSVFLLGLVIVTGLAGVQDSVSNFAPTFVWVVWWVGMAFVTALIGNVWPVLNPWQAVFEAVDRAARRLRSGKGITPLRYYPASWGVWPAFFLFLAFVWAQDAFPQSEFPNRLAAMAIVYTVVTLGGMFVFGKHAWLRHGEAFSVIFRTFARFSPTEVRVTDPDRCGSCGVACRDRDGVCVDCYECFEGAAISVRELNLRPYAAGLARNEAIGNDMLAVVILLLASVSFDGFGATGAWVDFQSAVVNTVGGSTNQVFNGLTLADTLGVLLFPALFLLVYLLFSRLMSGAAGGTPGGPDLARVFAYSLVPIALAYNIAHFIALLLVQGQLLVPLVSDPFGFGWDLLGTAGYTVDPGVINAKVLWFLSVAVIVVGHMLAVYLSHVLAARTFADRSAATASQYPMMALMVVYTVISLWIIAQPIVL